MNAIEVTDDASATAFFQKGLRDGKYDHLTKSDYHELLEIFAADFQSPSETFAQAYTRTIEKTEVGKAIYKAYKLAPNTAPGRVEKHAYIAEIQKRADERFPEIPTPQRRFAYAIDSSHGRPHDRVAHALYQTAKAAPGCDTAPIAQEPPADFHKADAEIRGPAHAKMHALAVDHQRARGNSYERAYAHVYSARENEALRYKVKSEHLSGTLRDVGAGTSGSDIDN